MNRYIITILAALFFCSLHAVAQEEPQQALNDEEDSLRTNSVDFDPLQYRLQRRYLPTEGDTAFAPRGWQRLFAGFSSGTSRLYNREQVIANTPLNVFVGYRFSPVHALRAQLSMMEMEQQKEHCTYTTMGLEAAYMVNLSNYINGYRPTRVFTFTGILGAGANINPHGLPRSLTPYVYVAPHLGFNLSRNLELYAEPFLGASGNLTTLYGYNTPSKFMWRYGVYAGAQINLDQSGSEAERSNPVFRRFFLEAANGWTFPFRTHSGLFHTSGMSYQVAMGHWIDPVVGLRLSMSAQQFYYGHDVTAAVPGTMGAYSTYRSEVLVAGRLEAMINPLNISQRWRQHASDSRFDMNLLVGADLGMTQRARALGQDRGLRCYYRGLTAATQLHYKLDNHTTIYLEPRFLNATYRIRYANTSSHLVLHDRTLTLSAGVRVYRPQGPDLRAIPRDFQPGWWTSLQLGGMKVMQKERISTANSSFQPSVCLSVARDFTPLATLRLSADYQAMGRNQLAHYISYNGAVQARHQGMTHTQYHLMDLRLLYMLDVTNLMQGSNSQRRLQAYLEAGPSWSIYMAQHSALASGEQPIGTSPRLLMRDYQGRNSMGVAMGILMAFRVQPQWDVTVESMGQYSFKHSFTPANSRLNNMKMIFSLGTRYHF